ncbi:DUF4367 domain-containing protein [Metabacillus elymi]|uniref:DUF4367 domain-containing protein n=1 Tax=Metabacillus elymi TaxID=2745198 RepID=A0ABX6S7K0_9BACI|nr:DUF4367 domain-containing protein [Metabacillus sp. KUDC1714]QNF30012.1 DUF4367 domain-containing protein [Metabacillus sp. KUDC1714]
MDSEHHKTYPWNEKEYITDFRLHYMEKNNKRLMFGIGEKKAFGHSENMVNDKAVNINGYKGYFSAFKASKNNENPVGGILRWVQKDPYLEMDSLTLTEEQMINIAK